MAGGMKTLHLNLKRKWFDLIYKRIKPEEYREIKPYWCARLLLYKGQKKNQKWWDVFFEVFEHKLVKQLILELYFGDITFIDNDTITFSNGMTPPVPRFEIINHNKRIGTGNPEWGAEQGKKYFVLELDKIIE